jgi:hypothetical protein
MCHTRTPGGVNAGLAAAAAASLPPMQDRSRWWPRSKANFFNAPRLPLMTFMDGYLLLVLFRTMGSRVFRGH